MIDNMINALQPEGIEFLYSQLIVFRIVSSSRKLVLIIVLAQTSDNKSVAGIRFTHAKFLPHLSDFLFDIYIAHAEYFCTEKEEI